VKAEVLCPAGCVVLGVSGLFIQARLDVGYFASACRRSRNLPSVNPTAFCIGSSERHQRYDGYLVKENRSAVRPTD